MVGLVLIEIIGVRSSDSDKVISENLKSFVICRKSTVRYKSTGEYLEVVHLHGGRRRRRDEDRLDSRFEVQGFWEDVDRAGEIAQKFAVGFDRNPLGRRDADIPTLKVADPGEVDMTA
jgi:hypothetical protein